MVTPAKKITSKGCERKRKPLQDVKLKAVHVSLQREDNEKEMIEVTNKDMSSEDMEIGNTKNDIALMIEDNDSDNEIMEIAEVMTTTLPGHVNCHQKSSYEKEETQEDEEEIEEIPRKEKAPIINEISFDYFLYNGKRYRMNQNPYLVHSSSIMLGDFPSSRVHISELDTWGLSYN
ncbi:hypothetical protein RJT34_01599 [Clitoria ternatea]|uniref:Uncharacterized protein n=1 Tax=Clitoria ternatea TaxID=43366 RepID=A0AAN9PZX8_CLITE